MDLIIVLGIGAILVATGVVTPKPKDEEIAEAEVVKTEQLQHLSEKNQNQNQSQNQSQNRNLHRSRNRSQNRYLNLRKNKNPKKR